MATYNVQRSGDLSILDSSNASSAFYGGGYGTFTLTMADLIDLKGYSCTQSADLAFGTLQNTGSTVTFPLSKNLTVNWINNVKIICSAGSANTPCILSVGRALGNRASPVSGLYNTSQDYILDIAPNGYVVLLGDVHLNAASGTITGIRVQTGGTLVAWYGDAICNLTGTASGMGGVYLSGGTLTTWYGNAWVTGTCYSAYGVYLMSGTLTNWYGNATVNTNGYGVYVSGATLTYWLGDCITASGYGVYLSSSSSRITNWVGDCYSSGSSSGSGSVYISSGQITNWFGSCIDSNTYSAHTAVYLMTSSAIVNWFGDVVYSGNQSGGVGLYVPASSSAIANWYGNAYINCNNGTAMLLSASGTAITTWRGNLYVNSVTPSMLYGIKFNTSMAKIGTWYGDVYASGGTAISFNSTYQGITTWYYYTSANGLSQGSNIGTLSQRTVAQRKSDFEAIIAARTLISPVIPNDTNMPSQANVLLNQARWPGDTAKGTLTLPGAADVARRAAGTFGVGGSGGAATCDIPTAAQTLYGVAVDANTGTVTLPNTGTNKAAGDPALVKLGASFGPGNATAGSLDILSDNPAPENVRAGVVYGNGQQTGTNLNLLRMS